MKILRKIPLIHCYLNTVVISLVFYSIFRLVYWLTFKDASNPIPTAELLHNFYLGLKFDLRLTLFILLPVFTLGWIQPLNPVKNSLARTLWFAYLVLAFAVTVFYYFASFINYSYLHQPLDASVLRFLDDFSLSVNMMWQSYPVVWLVLALIAITYAYSFLIRYLNNPVLKQAKTKLENNKLHFKRRWWQQVLFVTACIFIYIFGLFGKFSYYPLRWSDAFASKHPFSPAITVNPVIHFLDTLKNKSVIYDLAKTASYYNVVADYLGVKNKTDLTRPYKTLNFTRVVNKPGPLAKARPNIIIVYLESFASYKTGGFGNKLNPTPNFDAIADNAIYFKRFYTPHVGTARSVFTGITGIPDMELNRTSSRNPLIVDQHTLVMAFKNYKKHYFLGGSANWGNIRGVLSHNIKDLNMHEEGSYSAARVDVWGISDIDLFIEANKVLKNETTPFISIIQTSGNHRPYTIPDNNHGFKYLKPSKDELIRNGFRSVKEFNSFRFMDHSIGHFMKLARKEKYFDNTVFVFFGDHGISGYGGEHTPQFEEEFDLTGFHVPFVIYAPKLVKKQIYTKVASQVDMLPTIASLTTNGYINTTMGRDLLDPQFDSQRYAFTFTHQKIPDLGLVTKDYTFKILADGSKAKLYRTDPSKLPNPNSKTKQTYVDISAEHPELAEKYKQLTLGIYETSKYMLYHNKPLNQSSKSDSTTGTQK